ncbi:hypothetical protein AMS62_20575 [Bacillus sp. FJAT-18019]|nr:hypothetical protein AMS62_20575 [Bacillus sp. FJAT-18019]
MIRKMTQANITDYNKSCDGFTIIGRIVPRYEDGIWSYTEEIFKEHYNKQYELDDIDDSYIEDEDKAVYFYYEEDRCIGQIRLNTNWNGFGLVEEIYVAKGIRNKGIGTALLNQAEEWARQNQLIGLMLETQDVNLLACRFYAKHSFVIGAVDTMLYSKFPSAHEKAVFWYHRF